MSRVEAHSHDLCHEQCYQKYVRNILRISKFKFFWSGITIRCKNDRFFAFSAHFSEAEFECTSHCEPIVSKYTKENISQGNVQGFQTLKLYFEFLKSDLTPTAVTLGALLAKISRLRPVKFLVLLMPPTYGNISYDKNYRNNLLSIIWVQNGPQLANSSQKGPSLCKGFGVEKLFTCHKSYKWFYNEHCIETCLK